MTKDTSGHKKDPAPKKKRKRTSSLVKRPGKFLAENNLFAATVSWLAVRYLKLVYKTNSWQVEPENVMENVTPHLPGIAAVWHGQHILLPAIPMGMTGAVMISRSLDGEITARVAQAFGATPIRASGGRDARHTLSKGALKGFLDMLSALKDGLNVMQTADVPKGTARRAGRGIIVLAQKSGRPIFPMAVASSKRWVLPQSWDRTTINLPFGRSAIVAGSPIWVKAEASDDEIEAARARLELELNRVTHRAYELSGKPE